MAEWRALGYVPDSDDDEDETQPRLDPLTKDLADLDEIRNDCARYIPEGQRISAYRLDFRKEEAIVKEPSGVSIQKEEVAIQNSGTRSEIGQHLNASEPGLSNIPLLTWDSNNVDGISELQQYHEATPPVRLPAELLLIPSSEHEAITPSITLPRQNGESIQNNEAAIQNAGTRSEVGHQPNELGPEQSKLPMLIWDLDDVDGIDELQQDHEAAPPVRLSAELFPSSDREVITPSITPPRPQNHKLQGSLPSSPLTELTASPPAVRHSPQQVSPSRFCQTECFSRARVASPSSLLEPSNQNLQPAHLGNFPLDGACNGNIRTRNLRHRNPIQLHPYAIENEMYRQILRARGVKPLRLAPVHDSFGAPGCPAFQQGESDAEEDTQNHNMDLSSHQLPSSSPPFHLPLSSSPPPANDSSQSEEDLPEFAVLIQRRQSRPTQPNVHTNEKRKPRSITKSKWRRPLVVSPIQNGPENPVHAPIPKWQPLADVDDDRLSLPVSVTSSPPNRADFSEEEFPDVNALLRRHSEFASYPTKRRKLAHTPSKGTRRVSDQRRTLKGPQTPPTSDNLLDVPSPGRLSVARLESTNLPVFRGFSVPPEASPVKLPTPVASSEPKVYSSTARPAKVLSQTIVLSDPSSDDNEDLADSRIITSEDEADSDTEAAERETRPRAYFPKPTHPKVTQRTPQNRKRLKVQTSLDNVVRRKPMSHRHTHDRLNTRRHPQHNKENHYASKQVQKHGQSRNTDDSRPALLESLQEHDDRAHPQAALQRHVLKAIRDPNLPAGPNILLNRFLGEHQKFVESAPMDQKARRRPKRRYIRKPTPEDSRGNRRGGTHPERIELEPSEFEQRNPQRHIPTTREPPSTHQQGQMLHGLGFFGTEYTQNFEILPLPIGTFLHSSTFIGSGIFHQSLQLDKHEILDALRGYSLLTIAHTVFKWGPWNDVVSTQLGDVFHSVSEHLQSQSISSYHQSLSLLTDVVHYLSYNLSYLDPVDRVSSLQRLKSLLLDLIAELDAQTATLGLHQDLRLRFFTILLVYSNQLHKISTHQLVPEIVKVEINSHQLGISERVLHLALNVKFETLSACLRNAKGCEYGIKENSHAIEAVIIAHHVLRENENSLSVFWGIVWNVIIAQSSHDIIELRVLERSWQVVFTILPFLSFDDQGVMEPGHRFRVSNDGWPAVRQLVSCVLELHLANPSGQGATFNAYCRALFGRCLHLVNAWGWRRCESVISTMFAFFARNNLAHLRNEDSHGSPRYLENLGSMPDLLPSSEDRCFHIFLKLIGNGLSHMKGIYTSTKIRDIVWRLMPNHGRLHLKDETLSQRDVDALRNHHDLLCTLYWASPPAVRPRLSAIRNLVHLESAHREAYRIHIRAWSNLVRFQLSTDEEISALKPFAEWHDDFLVQLLRQHNSARTEAEDHFRKRRPDDGPVADDVLDAAVFKNERQAEVVLSDALESLNSVMHAVKNQEQATSLLTPALVSVLALFNARKSHANSTIVLALDVILTYASQSIVGFDRSTARESNDDSQDYGDWSAFEDVTIYKGDDAANNSAADHLLKLFYEPVKHLLSNAFGADTVPEDAILLKVVLVWVAVTHVLVCKSIKSWSDYLSPFAVGSWNSLRRTEQTQKFTPYYLAILLEKDTGIFREHKYFFLTSWIECLVERESMIKFQHAFTVAILNAGHEDPLLTNLPFCVDLRTGKFDISATDFIARRLLLISSLLSNMRVALEDAHCEMSSDLVNVRQEYVAMVKNLMNAMKRNYQELGQGSVVKGAYVEFVQRVIEFLQQHTSDFCPVDRFFVDSAGFPLPATDPTYIVGRLRNYGLRLHDSRTPKQLAVFLQSVCERAAVDGQQNYLAGQLRTAMSNVIERGSTGKPTLQSFLVKGIIPAYIEVAFGTSIGWLLVSPILQAVRDVFRQLFKSLDGASTSSINAVASILTAFLRSARNATRLLTDHSGLLEQSHILRLLKLVYSGISALVPVSDYIVRLTATSATMSAIHPPPSYNTLLRYIKYFKSFAIFASEILLDYEDPTSPQDDNDDDDGFISDFVSSSSNIDMQEIRDFALKELRDSISRNWVIHDGRYYVIRGNTRGDVVPEEFTYTQEKEGVIRAFEGFLAWCERIMPERGGKMVKKLEKGSSMMALGDLVF